ncbi:MAG: hypothetical protein K0R28_32 [Paenibacillus sp.]|jgi:hypothetical protein|nr:hypothetical protein [Paenibacillus sp.]
MSSYDVNVIDFGAIGDGAADDTAAFQKALDSGAGSVVVPKGDFKITSTIILPQNVKLNGIGPQSRLIKAFNGDMLKMENGSQLEDITLIGRGNVYSGRGIIIDSGSYQKLINCSVIDTASYCIEFTASAAGLISAVDNCVLYTFNRTNIPAIKFPDEEETGDRKVDSVNCRGGLLADFAGCSTSLVTNCNTIGVIFKPKSRKVSLVGNRIAGGTNHLNLDIYGNNHVVVGNVIATPIYLKMGTSNSTVMANVSGAVIDESGTGTNTLNPQRGPMIVDSDYGHFSDNGSFMTLGGAGDSPDAASISIGDGTGWKLNIGTKRNGAFSEMFSFYDLGCLYFSPMSSSNAVAGTLFVDNQDSQLKFKTACGQIRTVSLEPMSSMNESVASNVKTLRNDFNMLLSKLKNSGLMQ